MKRRDFIKGLVAVPVVAKMGVEAVANPKTGSFQTDGGLAMPKKVGLAPVKAEGATIEYDTPMNAAKALWPGIDKWYAKEYSKLI